MSSAIRIRYDSNVTQCVTPEKIRALCCSVWSTDGRRVKFHFGGQADHIINRTVCLLKSRCGKQRIRNSLVKRRLKRLPTECGIDRSPSD